MLMARAATRLMKQASGRSGTAGVSPWDASGAFYDILNGPRGLPSLSPRALVLLYAADLSFRLRWQILPALEEGTTVIASPYVETAIAFGRAAGLPQTWLREVLRFAPPAAETYRTDEEKLPFNKRGKPSDNFLEFCFLQLRTASRVWLIEEIRTAFFSHLRTLEARGKCKLAAK